MFRALAWAGGIIVVVAALITAWIVVPIVTSSPAGSSGQQLEVEGYPASVSATGDDGRTRTLEAAFESGEERDFSALVAGDRLIVSGSGFDPSKGIYVAVCKVPDSVGGKPGPCLGGVPSTEEDGDSTVGAVEYAASNWVNDDWAWRLFGARSFDDRALGSFTAYIEIPASADENVDCTRVSLWALSRAMTTRLSKTGCRTSTCRCLSPK
jgi:hypothetical protein